MAVKFPGDEGIGMYGILRSIGILLMMMGVGSFVLPKFNRDSSVWQSLGTARNPVMILSIVAGAVLFSLSYKLQIDREKEEAARRRAARELPRRRPAETEPEGEHSPADSTELAEASLPPDESAVAIASPLSPAAEWNLPETSPMVPKSRENEPIPVEAGSVIVTKASEETPQVVGEYTPVAEEKAGSESVVIEKTTFDPANRPLEKSPSSIMSPVSEKRMRSTPAFEEDPESIFDELPQKPPQSL